MITVSLARTIIRIAALFGMAGELGHVTAAIARFVDPPANWTDIEYVAYGLNAFVPVAA